MHLYETHLPVADTKFAESFYSEVVGLPFAYRDPTRDIVFLWADEKQKGMIGLWGASTGYGRLNGVLTPCHLAFSVSFEQLFEHTFQAGVVDSGYQHLSCEIGQEG